jgi:hypothetical protein
MFIGEWRLLLPSLKVVGLAIAVSAVFTLLVFRGVEPPAMSLLTELAGNDLAVWVGLALRMLMTSAGILWLRFTLREGWLRRREPSHLLLTLMLIALVAMPAYILHMFSSRYVVGGLGLLIVQLASTESVSKSDVARLLVGTAVGAGTLWSYYAQ